MPFDQLTPEDEAALKMLAGGQLQAKDPNALPQLTNTSSLGATADNSAPDDERKQSTDTMPPLDAEGQRIREKMYRANTAFPDLPLDGTSEAEFSKQRNARRDYMEQLDRDPNALPASPFKKQLSADAKSAWPDISTDLTPAQQQQMDIEAAQTEAAKFPRRTATEQNAYIDAAERARLQGAPEAAPKTPPPDYIGQPMAQFALAQRQPSRAATTTVSQAPRITVPRAKSQFSTGELGLAALADLILNRGQSIPDIIALGARNEDLDWKTQQRQMEADKTAAEIEHLRRVGTTAGMSPEALALRAQALELQKQRLSQSSSAEERRTRAQKIKEDRSDKDSDQSKAARTIAVNNGIPADQVENLSWDDIHSLYPSINKNLEVTGAIGQADVQHAARKAGAVAAATEASKIRVAEAGARVKAEAESLENAGYSDVPGWERQPGAPMLKPSESENLRKTNAAAEQYRDSMIRLRDAAEQVGPSDYAQYKLGIVTDAMSRALAAHSVVTTKQRQLENMGTPQAAELKLVQRQVPPPDDLTIQVNGTKLYGAMLNEYDQNHASMMHKYGYTQSGSQEAAPPPSRPNLGVTEAVPPIPKAAKARMARSVDGELVLPDGTKAKDTPGNRKKLREHGIGVQ